MMGGIDSAEDIANANLISAAPDMYEALKALVALLDSDDPIEVGCHCTDSPSHTVIARPDRPGAQVDAQGVLQSIRFLEGGEVFGKRQND